MFGISLPVSSFDKAVFFVVKVYNIQSAIRRGNLVIHVFIRYICASKHVKHSNES